MNEGILILGSLKRSPVKAYILTFITGGIFVLLWCSRLMSVINTEINDTFFNKNRIRNILVFSWAAGFLLCSLLLLGIISMVFVWVFFPILLVIIIVYFSTLFWIWYRIASGIREMEIKQNKSKLVKPWLAVVLVFPYFLSIIYLQSHVNKLEWADK